MGNDESRKLTLSGKIIHKLIKSLSALFVALVASLVGRHLLGYEVFGFIFLGVVFAGIFLKVFGQSSLMKVLIFNSFFIFFLLLLGIYINLAPTL